MGKRAQPKLARKDATRTEGIQTNGPGSGLDQGWAKSLGVSAGHGTSRPGVGWCMWRANQLPLLLRAGQGDDHLTGSAKTENRKPLPIWPGPFGWARLVLALALARAHFPFGTNSPKCMHHLCLCLPLFLLCPCLCLLGLFLIGGIVSPIFQKCVQKGFFFRPPRFHFSG